VSLSVIQVSGLRMRHGPREGARGLDLQMARREVFAFIGPNGAGETGTVEILDGHDRFPECSASVETA
jgi:lipooligosaccharide transport system ATP-binding protein